MSIITNENNSNISSDLSIPIHDYDYNQNTNYDLIKALNQYIETCNFIQNHYSLSIDEQRILQHMKYMGDKIKQHYIKLKKIQIIHPDLEYIYMCLQLLMMFVLGKSTSHEIFTQCNTIFNYWKTNTKTLKKYKKQSIFNITISQKIIDNINNIINITTQK